MVSNNASLSAADIVAARVSKDQPLFFQLYKRKDDDVAAERVREVEAMGYNAIFLTVDAPVAGSRERDIRAPFVLKEQERLAEVEAKRRDGAEAERPQAIDEVEKDEDEVDVLGTAGGLLQSTDSDLSWEKVNSTHLGPCRVFN